MTDETLAIFIDVVECGSFASVARLRDLDPSRVSRQIAGLEVELGAKLFQRTTRKLSLTDAGETYYRAVQPAVERLQEARQIVRDLNRDLSGQLRVTTSTAFGTEVLVPLLARWRDRYPRSQVELILSDSRLDMVESGVDLALRLGPGDTAGERLLRTCYRVCMSSTAAVAIDPMQLAEMDCLLFPFEGFRTRWIFEARDGDRMEVQVKGDLTISNALALRQACLQGMGPALLADWLTEPYLESGELVDLFPDHKVTATDFETGVWAVLPPHWETRDRYRPKRIDAFLEFLREQL